MDKKIMLVVDDVKINRTILQRMFSDSFNILQVEDGREALKIISQCHKDIAIIILDIIMPIIDGFGVLEIMQKNSNYREIPVIIVTSNDEIDMEARALEAGAWDVIGKPYDPMIIKRRVQSAISKRQLAENRSLKERSNAQIHLDAVVKNMSEAVSLINMNNDVPTVIFGNERYYQLMGYNINYNNITDKIIDRLVIGDRRKIINIYNKVLSTGNTANFEVQIMKIDGDTAWLEIKCSRIIYNSDEQNPAIMTIYKDVSIEKEQEEMERMMYEQLRYRANHDELTGIYNRQAFVEKTANMLKDNPHTNYIIVRCNIDRFRLINDMFGTKVGDAVLMDTANGLEKWIQNQGTYGRIECDHFVCCVPKSYWNHQMAKDAMRKIFLKNKVNYNVLVSFGIYEVDDRTLSVDTMCDRANLALQRIKGNYFTTCAVYDEKLLADNLEEQSINLDAEKALEEGQFILFFQPIYNLIEQKTVSAEALVRWQHPQKGLLMPSKFIPIFEKNGLISKLDYYVWEKACAFIGARKQNNEPIIPISVNISRRSIYDVNLVSVLLKLVEKYKIDKNFLKLEITESAYMEDPILLGNTVKSLRDKGFTILMDDFGSGYSSLNMLKDLLVDILKMDMHFMEGFENSPRARTIVTSIIRMSNWLNIPVVAEGVETKEQMEFLRGVGCENIQGYYYSRPMPEEQFTDHLKTLNIPMTVKNENIIAKPYTSIVASGNEVLSRIIDGFDAAIGFYEYSGGELQVVRVNKAHQRIFGCKHMTVTAANGNVWASRTFEDRKKEEEIILDVIRKRDKITLIKTIPHPSEVIKKLKITYNYLSGNETRALLSIIIEVEGN